MALYGAIEGGGTKWVLGVGTGRADLETTTIPTTTPEETLAAAIQYFQTKSIAALGIASFGPVDLHRDSPTYGFITSTPKPGWRDTDVRGVLARALNVPTGFDTDVNAAALGEGRWGAGRGLRDLVYLTVGTGIGGGAICGGRLVHGRLHPEMGHLPVPHDRGRDSFPGCCPFHGDCLEGLASGPALEKRWGVRAELLPSAHEAWALEAHYLASGLASMVYALSPERIIVGGGVGSSPSLLSLLRPELEGRLNGYLTAPDLVAPGLGSRSGILGALLLAEQAAAIG